MEGIGFGVRSFNISRFFYLIWEFEKVICFLENFIFSFVKIRVKEIELFIFLIFFSCDM